MAINQFLTKRRSGTSFWFSILAATFVFAISGAMLGVRRKLDFFGVLALSFAASSAGGIARDLTNRISPASRDQSIGQLFAVAMPAG